MKKLRQSTVEPVFGSLVHYYGLRRIGVLGNSGAHKVMLMAAVAFNLRKYMKFKPVKAASMVMALEKEQQGILLCCLLAVRAVRHEYINKGLMR